MNQRGFRNSWVVTCVWCAAACGQDLQLPQPPPKQETAAAKRPSEGITGAAGFASDAAPPARLPLPTEPTFTSFGGEGGQGDADRKEPGTETLPGAGGGAGAGGTKAVAGAGGTKAVAGAGGTLIVGGALDAGGEGGDAAPSEPGVPQLFFSEYVEGSSSFKALEIFASSPSSLEGCELDTYFNGKLEPARLALHGELAAGQTYVLCSSTLATAEPAACSRSTSLTFNGDDAIALDCGGALLDLIGEIGVDPGDSWASGATADHTLRRRCSVTQGRPANAPFDVDAEWITFGADTFSDLGRRVCESP